MHGKLIRLLLLFTCLSVISTAQLAANDELELNLDGATRDWISGTFRNERIDSISIGGFECVGDQKVQANMASGGMEIARRLKDVLEKNKFKVDTTATAKIHGEYMLKKDNERHYLYISFKLTDTNTFKEIVKFARNHVEIRRPDLVAKLIGLTGDLAGENNEKRALALNKLIDKPKAQDGNAGSIVKSDPNSDFGMEILVKNPETGEYRARGTRIQGGMPFIQLNKGDVYSVRFYNQSKEPVAVDLSLDGLGTLALNDNENLRQGRYIISPGQTAEIKGWSINNEPEGAHEFKIGAFDESIAARKLPRERLKVGMITATFARAWDAKNPPPDVRNRPAIKDSPDKVANVLGNRITQELEIVDFEFGFPSAVVTIRYSDETPADLPPK
jgi:hypothetical protein